MLHCKNFSVFLEKKLKLFKQDGQSYKDLLTIVHELNIVTDNTENKILNYVLNQEN